VEDKTTKATRGFNFKQVLKKRYNGIRLTTQDRLEDYLVNIEQGKWREISEKKKNLQSEHRQPER